MMSKSVQLLIVLVGFLWCCEPSDLNEDPKTPTVETAKKDNGKIDDSPDPLDSIEIDGKMQAYQKGVPMMIVYPGRGKRPSDIVIYNIRHPKHSLRDFDLRDRRGDFKNKLVLLVCPQKPTMRMYVCDTGPYHYLGFWPKTTIEIYPEEPDDVYILNYTPSVEGMFGEDPRNMNFQTIIGVYPTSPNEIVDKIFFCPDAEIR